MAKRSNIPAGREGRPIRLPFPIKGTDQGWALVDQPPLTTPNLLNVRSLDWRQRQGGGKRHGHSKAVATQAGISGARRVTELAAFAAATGSPTGDGAVAVDVDDDFSGAAVAQPTDFGNNWVYCNQSTAGNGISDNRTALASTANGLQFDVTFSVTQAPPMLFAARFPTTNDVTATLRCRPKATTTSSNYGAADDCPAFGPFIRGSGRLNDLVAARLVRNASNTSILIRIERWLDSSPTTLGSSGAIAISGGATVVEDATLRLYEDGSGNVIAVLNWPSESITNSTLTVATAQNAGNSRGGVGLFAGDGGSWSTTSAYRTFARAALTMLQPASGIVLHTISRLTAGTNRYYIPPGFTSVHNTAGPTQTLINGVYDSASIPTGAGGNTTAVDTTSATLRGGGTSVAGAAPFAAGAFFRTDETADGPFTAEFQARSGNSTGANESSAQVLLRPNATYTDFLLLNIVGPAGSATQDTTEIGYLSGTALQSVTAGAVGATGNDSIKMPFRAGASWVRVTDDGTTITLSVDGNVYQTFTDTSFAGRTGIGIGPCRYATGGTVGDTGLEAVRWLSRTNSLDIRQSNPIFLALTHGLAQIGNITEGTLDNTTGAALDGDMPQAFALNGLFYAVDGVDSKIIDPLALATTDWANEVLVSGQGALPSGCRLACHWRGRAVLARTPSQGWMWFMSRVGFPLDWDYLNSNVNGGVATAANFGTNADVGVPGEVINALIPFTDDYLYFGCASSIWMMEGDPSYGGSVQNVSYRTGVVGPRAFAFDEGGNLYFMGAAGLYRIERGGKDPVNVSGRKLINLLEKVPLDTTLVQLAWDAAGRYLNVYLTPTDAVTPGHHCIYDPSTKAYWIDQYPVRFGPWSVAEITGALSEDRRVLIGGDDGYIRRPDGDTFTDDGDAIDSWVEIGPFELAEGTVYSIVTELQAMIGAGSASVTWYWFTADSPEEVAALDFGSEVASGTWINTGSTNGFQTPVGLRQTGGAHKIRVRQNVADEVTWSLERIVATLGPTGRRRI